MAVHALHPSKRGLTGPWTSRDEPRWHEASDFRKAIDALSPTNGPLVSAALALAPASVREITTFRNFYAHRGRTTASKAQDVARRYLLTQSNHPTAILNAYPTGRPQVLLADFIDDLDAVIGLVN